MTRASSPMSPPNHFFRGLPLGAGASSAPPAMLGLEHPLRNMGPAPVLGHVPSSGQGEGKATRIAGSSKAYPLNVMGARPPPGLGVLQAPEEVIGLQPLPDALADHHSPQDHPQPTDTRGAEGVLECLLEGVKHPTEGEAELAGSCDAVHFQVVKTQPAAAQEGGRHVPVEGPLAGIVERARQPSGLPSLLMHGEEAVQMRAQFLLSTRSEQPYSVVLEEPVGSVSECGTELRLKGAEVRLVVVRKQDPDARVSFAVDALPCTRTKNLRDQPGKRSPSGKPRKSRTAQSAAITSAKA